MRYLFILMLCVVNLAVSAQQDKEAVMQRMRSFHQVLNDAAAIRTFVHDSVSYGHSNGWIQTKTDLSNDAGVKTVYHSYKEDSIQVVVSGNTAYARFIADIEVSLNGKKALYHLKVLEVWMKENDQWKIL